MFLRSLFLLLLCTSLLQAQDKSTTRWYFGNKQGLNFNTTPPSLLSDGQTTHIEGTSVVCDAATGDLLFYTDGNTIWTKTHAVMATNLNPNYLSSTQSALIVRRPGSNTLYHMFTTENQGQGKARQFIVDMSANGGQGAIISSNNAITPLNVTEKVTATRACNGIDYWIIFRRNGAGQAGFYSYRLTPAGLLATPVSSAVGVDIVSAGQNIGEMKISPDGRFIACAQDQTDADLFDFNNATGVVSNSRALTVNSAHNCYGLTFSASSRFLYINSGWRGPQDSVVRFDLSAASIQGSRQTVGRSTAPLGFMELAPDGNIYIARYNTQYLATISNPDAATPVFNDQAVTLSSNTYWGLPNFPQDLFIPNYAGSDTSVCPNSPIRLGIPAVAGLSYAWTPSTGLDNANIAQPTANINSTRTYTVTVSDANSCQIVRSLTVTVRARPTFSASSNAANNTICAGNSVQLSANAPTAVSYSWQPGNLSGRVVTLSPTSTTTYLLSIVDANNCTWIDSINIRVNPRPTLRIIPSQAAINDTVRLCQGMTTNLNVDSPFATYLWSTGADTREIVVNTTGRYSVRVTDDKGCINSDSVFVLVFPLPQVRAGNDTAVCAGSTLQLQANINAYVYRWTALNSAPTLSDSTLSNPRFSSQTAGTFLYRLVVTDTNGCVNRDTIQITSNPLPVAILSPAVRDTAICTCESIVLSVNSASSYQWFKDGVALASQQSQSITVSDTGAYNVRISDNNNCSSVSSTINVHGIVPSASIAVRSLDSALAGQNVALQLVGTGRNFTRCNVDSLTVNLSMEYAPLAPSANEVAGTIVNTQRLLSLRVGFVNGVLRKDLNYIGTLGIIDTTIIRIDSIRWDGCPVPTFITNDTFRLAGVCRARGKRLIEERTVIYLVVMPNPLKDGGSLAVESNADIPNCRISLRDVLGRTVAQLYEGELKYGLQQFDMRAQNISDGTYLVVIESNKGVITEHVEVRK